MIKKHTNDFVEFVRNQGVIGFSIAFVIGGAVTKLVSALVEDLINPLLGIILGKAAGLQTMKLMFLGAEFKIGHFVSAVIDFIVIALVIYIVFKQLRLEKLDKKKE